MPKLRTGTLHPSAEEDAAITAAALSDPDAIPYTDAEWEATKPTIRRGRPPAAVTKERITIRLSRDVVEQFRATGDGWQTRMDAALKDWLKTHSPASDVCAVGDAYGTHTILVSVCGAWCAGWVSCSLPPGKACRAGPTTIRSLQATRLGQAA